MCFSPALLALLVVCMHDVCMCVWWFGSFSSFLLLHIFFSCVEECVYVRVCVGGWVGVGVQPLIDSYESVIFSESESRVV